MKLKFKKYQLGGQKPSMSFLTEDDDPTLDYGSSIYSNINEKVDNEQAATNASGGFSYKQGFRDAIPYLTNVVNAFTKLPKPSRPMMETTVNPSLVSFNADKAELDKTLRGLNVGVDTATPNPSIARSAKVSNLAKVLEAKGKLSQQEKNLNAGITNDVARTNTFIKGRNVDRVNEFRDAILSRKLNQQRLNRENIADASNKFQLQERDRDMMDLEDRKLDLLPILYKDTGVVDRNLLGSIEEERYPRRRKLGGYISRQLGGPIASSEEMSSNVVDPRVVGDPIFKTEAEFTKYHTNKVLNGMKNDPSHAGIYTKYNEAQAVGDTRTMDAMIGAYGGIPKFTPPATTETPVNPTDWKNLGFTSLKSRGYRYGARRGKGLPAKGSITNLGR